VPSPKQTAADKLFHQGEPYHFQRKYASTHSSYPRAPQPNTNQPNRNYKIKAGSSREYFQKAYEDYLNRQRS